MGVIEGNSLLKRFWSTANARFLGKASSITTITEEISRGAQEYLPLAEKHKVMHIAIWGDHHNIKPIEKLENLFIKAHNLQDYFIVLYSGNFGSTHSMDDIMKAANLLSEERKIKFFLIGGGAQKKRIEKTIKEKKLENVLILPWQPEDQLKYTFSSADIGLVTLSEGIESVSIPSKTFSYLSAGVPVIAIANKVSELTKILQEKECGLQVDVDAPNLLASEIVQLKKEPQKYSLLKRNALIASESYTDQNAKRIYHFIYKNLN
jgi:glycosyltransferase involved in cell wall biosynthesis